MFRRFNMRDAAAAANIMKSGDWVIIALALLAALAAAVMVWRPAPKEAGTVRIYIDSELRNELPLNKNGRYTFENGGAINEIEINDGRVRMINANCADRCCVRQGAIRYQSETIICLPHRFVVELADGPESGLDAIAG